MNGDANPLEAAQPPPSRLLTVQELAELLQVPAKTIYTWRYKGVGPQAVRIGRHLRFRAEDVVAWLDAQVGPETPGLRTNWRRGHATVR
jgi:excisionase family DNA binding protein